VVIVVVVLMVRVPVHRIRAGLFVVIQGLLHADFPDRCETA